MFVPSVGWFQAVMDEKRREADKLVDDDMRKRLSEAGSSAIEIEMASLRAREVRAIERLRR